MKVSGRPATRDEKRLNSGGNPDGSLEPRFEPKPPGIFAIMFDAAMAILYNQRADELLASRSGTLFLPVETEAHHKSKAYLERAHASRIARVRRSMRREFANIGRMKTAREAKTAAAHGNMAYAKHGQDTLKRIPPRSKRDRVGHFY
jgi:hypothetical protein